MINSNTNANVKIDNKKGVYIIIGVFLLCFGLGLLFSNNNNNNIQGIVFTDDGLSATDNSKFEILGSSSNLSEDGTYTINGKIQQKEEKNFDGLFITFTMYDNNNNKVRSTSMNTSNYLGNGIWEFSAIGNDADKIVTSYKLETVYGY